MSIEVVRSALLWCTIINFGLYVFWALLFVLPHDWMHRLCSKFFRLSSEQFDAINYTGIVFYKAAVLMFNLVPYIALRIAG